MCAQLIVSKALYITEVGNASLLLQISCEQCPKESGL